jgi:hypothetical protein
LRGRLRAAGSGQEAGRSHGRQHPPPEPPAARTVPPSVFHGPNLRQGSCQGSDQGRTGERGRRAIDHAKDCQSMTPKIVSSSSPRNRSF